MPLSLVFVPLICILSLPFHITESVTLAIIFPFLRAEYHSRSFHEVLSKEFQMDAFLVETIIDCLTMSPRNVIFEEVRGFVHLL